MMIVKRVAIVHSSGAFAILDQEFPHWTRNIDILNTLYEVGKNTWIGNDLYKIVTDVNGYVCYFKYEIYKVKLST